MTDASTAASTDDHRVLRLLHRVDAERRQLTFVRTTPAALRAAPFLDGRAIFWEGAPEMIAFADAARPAPAPAAETIERFIFHVSFCGSTLLASVLGDACEATVLKEPHGLVDLADWKKALDEHGAADPDFGPILSFARDALQRLGPSPVVIKPSNWVNNLLPELSRGGGGAAHVYVTMERRAFIAAVFRGGRDRLAFTARAASHLASAFDGGAALVQSAIAAAAEPLGRVANLCALTHALQLRLFHQAASRLPPGCTQHIDFQDIGQDLEAAVRTAARALRLEICEERLRRAVAEWTRKDPKRPGAGFSQAAHDQASAEVERLHGAPIGAALDWASRLSALNLLDI